VKRYRFEADAAVEFDVKAAFDWYETEEPGLGVEFLEQVRAVYRRILENPFGYHDLRSGIRRALTRRFPYAIYYSIEEEVIIVLGVLHTARDPEEWQRRM
jgi:plasmid stabilization system protein ParE